MPLDDNNRGTEKQGAASEDYCLYCYKDGAFTQEFTMGQMIEFCARFTDLALLPPPSAAYKTDRF